MTALADFIPAVRTHLAGAPEVTVSLYLENAAQQFCRDSNIWEVRLGTKEVMPQTFREERRYTIPDTDFTLPDGAFVNSISIVELGPTSEETGDWENIDNRIPRLEWRWDPFTSELVLPPGTINQTVLLRVTAVLEPARGATEIPDVIAQKWGEAIVNYAIFKMMLMPGQPWSVPPMVAETFRGEYTRRLAEATVEKARGGTQRGILIDPVPFV